MIERFEGALIRIDQQETNEARQLVARHAGLLCDSGALSVAGVKRAAGEGMLKRGANVLAVLDDRGRITQPHAAADQMDSAIEPTIDAVEALLDHGKGCLPI
jgi:hypothetical protein